MSRGRCSRAAAGACGVLGAWEVLATAEAARVAERLERAVAPLGRARREGLAPSGVERRRLGWLAAGSLFAAGWLLGGPLLGLVAALTGPAAVSPWCGRGGRATARSSGAERPAPPGRSPTRSRPATRSAGRSTDIAPTLPGAAGHELRMAARSLELGEPTEAVLERLRARARTRAWDTLVAAILLQREAGGDLPALLRELASALEAGDRLERDARAATAQARFTAWLVVAPAGRGGGAGGARGARLPPRAGRRAAPRRAHRARVRPPGDRPRGDPPDRPPAARVTPSGRRWPRSSA